jgi:hypothetical protein
VKTVLRILYFTREIQYFSFQNHTLSILTTLRAYVDDLTLIDDEFGKDLPGLRLEKTRLMMLAMRNIPGPIVPLIMGK